MSDDRRVTVSATEEIDPMLATVGGASDPAPLPDPSAVTVTSNEPRSVLPSVAAYSDRRLGESSLGATAIMPPAGPSCTACGKANHSGVLHCVFCGAPLVGSMRAPLIVDAPRMPERESIVDAMAPLADPLLGVVVADRYRIVDLLGRGGMGIVYKVEHTRIGKLLAMKLLTGELSRNPEVVRRFKQEALTVSKLSSPNTVQVFDFGVSDGLTYLVMELVAGEDLGKVLRTHGPMPFARLGKILIQVCSSLAEAHQKGIVHRDIKPENIMLLRGRDATDVAKVLDFGLAKLREGADLNDVTSQGAIVGTPYFMAPEQIRGEPVDARADVYALGALMYRALTGHYPFSGPTPMAVFTKHLTEEPIPPEDRAPELAIPPGVSRVVLTALAKDPAARFQRVDDLQAALVDEVRTLGMSSVDDLLDSGQLRKLARASQVIPSAIAAGAEIATRDEVEAYERKLRAQRWGAVGVLFMVLLAAAAVGVKLLIFQPTEFSGLEVEPNNTAGDATPVPFGRAVTGFLGKRIDATHGDRDFYAIDVPAPAGGKAAHVKLRASSLPNFATCTLLYRQGLSTALAQYCVGKPGRDLVVPALRLEPGRYLVAVLQDMDPYGAAQPYVHENISDPYALAIDAIEPDPGSEIEPNDQVASANVVTPAGGEARSSLSAALGWARDEDVFCVPAGTPGKIRWKVDDKRHDGGVIEATPLRGTTEGAPVRIHRWGNGKVTAGDVKSPWVSEAAAPEEGVARCLRLRLVADPWSGESAGVVPNGGSEPYVIEVESAP